MCCIKFFALTCAIFSVILLVGSHFVSWYAIAVGQSDFDFLSSGNANVSVVVMEWTTYKVYTVDAGGSYWRAVPIFGGDFKEFSYKDNGMNNTVQLFAVSLALLVVATIAIALTLPPLFMLVVTCECFVPKAKLLKEIICMLALVSVVALVISICLFLRSPDTFSEDKFCKDRVLGVLANGTANVNPAIGIVSDNATGMISKNDSTSPINHTTMLATNDGTSDTSSGNESYWCSSILGSSKLDGQQSGAVWAPMIGFWIAAISVIPSLLVVILIFFSSRVC